MADDKNGEDGSTALITRVTQDKVTDIDNKSNTRETLPKYYTDEKGRQICNITDDGLVKKIMVKTNESGVKVSQHIMGRVWINMKGETANGNVFKDELFEEVSLLLGKAEESKGIDQALVTMKHNEHAIIEIYDIEKYGYPMNKSPLKCPKTNEKKEEFPLKYNVIVIDSLPKQKQSHEMTFVEQLNWANLLRERGNKRYEKKRFKTALDFYNRAVQCLDAMDDIDMNMPNELQETKVSKEELNECKLKCYLNCSICHRRLKDNNECIKWCTKALKINDKNKKALIRRALSYYDLTNYKLAKNDMIKFHKLANDEKERDLIKKYLDKIQIAKQKQKDKEKKIYGGFLVKKSKKNLSLYEDKTITKNKDNDSFVWKIILAIPNGIVYVFNGCTKYCRKNKND
eukprot:479663_1